MDKTDAKIAMEELTMMLIYLSHFTEQDRFANKDDKYAWKGYNFDVLNKLDEKDYIRQGSHRAKSMYITKEDRVFFSVEIEKVLNSIHVSGTGLELMPKLNPGKSVVRFAVKKKNAGADDNDDEDAETNVPFQIAYAVSIHKAQGLEYNSVKIVITKEVDEMITHNIFYTAITRARENLKVYWTPESQKKILDSFINDETSYDAKIFSARTGLKIIKKRVV